MRILWCQLGEIPYEQSMRLMNGLREDIQNGSETEYLLFLEHPNVITRGYSERGGDSGLLSSRQVIEESGFEIIDSDRGGKTTLHNPGQLVAYLVFDLKRNKLKEKEFVALIEETMVAVLNTYELTGETVKGDPGAFVGGKKIGAIGLKFSKQIATHGFSFNVRNDLRPFSHIIPCGEINRPVTSLRELIGEKTSIYDATWRFVTCFKYITGADLKKIRPEELD